MIEKDTGGASEVPVWVVVTSVFMLQFMLYARHPTLRANLCFMHIFMFKCIIFYNLNIRTITLPVENQEDRDKDKTENEKSPMIIPP